MENLSFNTLFTNSPILLDGGFVSVQIMNHYILIPICLLSGDHIGGQPRCEDIPLTPVVCTTPHRQRGFYH